MKLARSFLAIALLVCAAAAPAYAQQTQSQSGATAQEDPPNRERRRRSPAAGHFAVDVAGHNAGFIDKVEGDEQTAPATVQRVGPAAAAVVRPSTMVRPGTIVLAPVVTDDKDDD